jgi:hypothetical protein
MIVTQEKVYEYVTYAVRRKLSYASVYRTGHSITIATAQDLIKT